MRLRASDRDRNISYVAVNGSPLYRVSNRNAVDMGDRTIRIHKGVSSPHASTRSVSIKIPINVFYRYSLQRLLPHESEPSGQCDASIFSLDGLFFGAIQIPSKKYVC